MSERLTVYLVGPRQVETAKAYVADQAHTGWRMELTPPAKKRIQEERYHAMIGEIAKQCTHYGRKLPAESWKRLLVEAFVHVLREEARAQGKTDPFPDRGTVLPSLDGLRFVQVEVLTRTFTVGQATQFIEHLFAYGAENAVAWSEPAAAEPA